MNKLPNGTRIPTLEALNDALADGNTEFAIVLHGPVISRKTITAHGTRYRVESHIDDVTEIFTAERLLNPDDSNIGTAMKKGALIVCDRQH